MPETYIYIYTTVFARRFCFITLYNDMPYSHSSYLYKDHIFQEKLTEYDETKIRSHLRFYYSEITGNVVDVDKDIKH